MSSEAIDCLGDKLDKVIDWLERLELQSRDRPRSENRATEPNDGGHVGQPGPVLQQNASRADIQGEFASIRDSVYAETVLKLLALHTKNSEKRLMVIWSPFLKLPWIKLNTFKMNMLLCLSKGHLTPQHRSYLNQCRSRSAGSGHWAETVDPGLILLYGTIMKTRRLCILSNTKLHHLALLVSISTKFAY